MARLPKISACMAVFFSIIGNKTIIAVPKKPVIIPIILLLLNFSLRIMLDKIATVIGVEV